MHTAAHAAATECAAVRAMPATTAPVTSGTAAACSSSRRGRRGETQAAAMAKAVSSTSAQSVWRPRGVRAGEGESAPLPAKHNSPKLRQLLPSSGMPRCAQAAPGALAAAAGGALTMLCVMSGAVPLARSVAGNQTYL